MSTHPLLEESLRRNIDHLRAKVTEMGNLCGHALKESVQALTERNRLMAYSVILRDQHIDELETEVNRLCLEFLVRHQPVSQQLRFIFSAIQINRELERIGDYAESIARQVLQISRLEPQPPYDKFVELGNLAVHMLRDSVQSFQQQDGDLAQRTMAIEEHANILRNNINADLKELIDAGRLPADSLTPLQTVARRLERVTDQAKNLCEEVVYMCTGEFARHKGADGFRILFLDASNGCLSQMAEAIANSLHRERYLFNSAGLTPQPLDQRILQFLAGKGVDVSRHSSKSLEQVPDWEYYQLIICFGKEVRDVAATHPGKRILFNWRLKDPSETSGTPEAFQAALEETYHALDSHVRELMSAVLQESQPDNKT